jgi:predicted AAA+ superfamily ATPase
MELLREYLDRIIYRDIVGRESVKYPDALRTIAIYMISNVGKEFSYRSLREITGIKHEVTIKEYVAHLENAFLLEVVRKYSPSLKIQESYAKKVYASDIGFLSLGKRATEDAGRRLENAIYLHLKNKYEVFFGKNSKEVDFVLCENLKPVKVVNVTYEARDKKTIKREVSGIRYFMKEYGVPGEIVSMYPFDAGEIPVRLAHRFCLEL